MHDLRSYSDDELNELIDEVRSEKRRREAVNRETEAINLLQVETQSALGIVIEHGEQWKQPVPGDRSTMYPQNQVVSHNGKLHMSKVPYNHWEPDEDAPHYLHTWQRYSEPDSGPEIWDPEKQYTPPVSVIHNDKVYELIHTHSAPGWVPGHPSLSSVWKEVDPHLPDPEPEPEPEPDPEPEPEPEPEFPAWDPALEYQPPVVVSHNGDNWELTNTHSSPGWEPGDPALHSIWRKL